MQTSMIPIATRKKMTAEALASRVLGTLSREMLEMIQGRMSPTRYAGMRFHGVP